MAATVAFAFLSLAGRKSHHRGTPDNGLTRSYCEISNNNKILLCQVCCTEDLQVRQDDPSEGQCAVELGSSCFIPSQDLALQFLLGLLSIE